jgi:hypothetical protein
MNTFHWRFPDGAWGVGCMVNSRKAPILKILPVTYGLFRLPAIGVRQVLAISYFMARVHSISGSASACLDLPVCDQPRKMLKGPVVRFFGTFRETASWKLTAFQMIADAFTADAFFGTGFIAAIATIEVLFFFALHRNLRAKATPVKTGVES